VNCESEWNKTERNTPGGAKWTVDNQPLTTTKTERPFRFVVRNLIGARTACPPPHALTHPSPTGWHHLRTDYKPFTHLYKPIQTNPRSPRHPRSTSQISCWMYDLPP